MIGPHVALLPDGQRLHLQHGPIDLIISADGDRHAAYHAATTRFQTILQELVDELPLLRSALDITTPAPQGAVARRMHRAAHPFCSDTFLTPMAAVAGSVADEVLAAMCAQADMHRAYVNNGGDIALHLAPGAQFRTAMMDHTGNDLGQITIKHSDPVRGIASSGRHGRSFSLGVADSVTVLAQSAARADAAATLIANAVDLPGHPAIKRQPANTLTDDSDLGTRPVVTHCAPLTPREVEQALSAGLATAEDDRQRGLIIGASLTLQAQTLTTDARQFSQPQRILAHA